MNSHRRKAPALGPSQRLCASISLLLLGWGIGSATLVHAQPWGDRSKSYTSISTAVMLQIVRAEDERRWDADLQTLLADKNVDVQRRAVLAVGRIGDERAVMALVTLLEKDTDQNVRAMAAFALGEIEAPAGRDALIALLSLDQKEPAEIRARAVEALGKIAAALPKSEDARARPMREAILAALDFEAGRRSLPDTETILLGLTAALRAKPENSGQTIARFLFYSDPRVRADAANTLARLKLSDGNEKLRELLTSDPDPVVRSNAARVLGATEDKAAFEALLERLKDSDARVRVSTIRVLATFKDQRAIPALLSHGSLLLGKLRAAKARKIAAPTEQNELIEIGSALGRIMQAGNGISKANAKNTSAFHSDLHELIYPWTPELEVAFARVSPVGYLDGMHAAASGRRGAHETLLTNWRAASSLAQGLGEIAAVPDSTKDSGLLKAHAEENLRAMLDYQNSGININTLVAVHSEYAVPDVLRALAAFKPKDLGEVLRKCLKESDAVVRATAAELLGDLPPAETNARALAEALKPAFKDELNDAALAILDSLGKQKSGFANDAIKTALETGDPLIRRKAVIVLKANGVGDFSDRNGRVQSRNTMADYARAIARIGKQVRATVNTSKGSFVIELLPDDAPLNVDNFIQLSKRGYFNRISFHRVVPNFVIQGGDPRGDGNGGPGYQIRCEINEVPYGRGAVGMALSGKDTGGSQWFVTHSPQPHLDGGYSVFGRVISGMDVVDNIVRGDIIRSVVVNEGAGTARPTTRGSLPARPQKRA